MLGEKFRRRGMGETPKMRTDNFFFIDYTFNKPTPMVICDLDSGTGIWVIVLVVESPVNGDTVR